MTHVDLTEDLRDMSTADLQSLISQIQAEIAERSNGEQRQVILRRKDLNSRGNGDMQTRRVHLPDGTTGWASELAQCVSGSWESGSFLASQRRCAESGSFPVGTVVLAYDSRLRGGKKTGAAYISAGVVVGVEEGRQVRADRGIDDGKSDAIRWGLSTRGRGSDVEVQMPDGQWTSI